MPYHLPYRPSPQPARRAPDGDGGNCVEVALGHPEAIPVRDSKTAHHGGPVLLFRTTAWSAFLAEVKQGRTT
ncbi:DUF397 domain-containing protein [Streptomyces yerevanensis]|uniref:DUF397 domain-containing protein n=1 Tax=Streptomyces yerevanensis TaxID=66378 RepID=UPI0009983C02|nr:DUF397 domain-containing protein [Streptomyces yerevanensis]